MSQLFPPFLVPLPQSAENTETQIHATYTHSEKLGKNVAHCQWWPCKSNAIPSIILLFVPGNPGVIDFYLPFFEHIRSSAVQDLAILAHAHLGHTPRIGHVPLSFTQLHCQVEAVNEVIDSLGSAYGPSTKLVLIGHSVGSWLVLQCIKERSSLITGAFLLFPTITHIMRTPNGDRMSWLFHPPFARLISYLSNLLLIMPKRAIAMLFRDYPPEQFEVLWNFISSPPAVLNSISMAHEEMITIKDLDIPLIQEVKHKLYFYLAEKDNWVGEKNKSDILREMSDEPHSVRVVHGEHGIPHAYCINHSKELAIQCLQWLEDDIFR